MEMDCQSEFFCVHCSSIIVCVLGAGKLNTDCRGQHLSIDDLLEKEEVEYTHIQHTMCT